MKKIPETIRLQVVKLRKEGKTYGQIKDATSIGKGTISSICKEAGLGQSYVELTPEKKQLNFKSFMMKLVVLELLPKKREYLINV